MDYKISKKKKNTVKINVIDYLIVCYLITLSQFGEAYGCPIAHLLFLVYEFHFYLIYMISRIPGYLGCIPRYLTFIPRYLSCIFQYVLVLKKFPDIQLQFPDIDVFPVTLTVPSLPSLPSHCDDVTFTISAPLAGVVSAFLGTCPSATRTFKYHEALIPLAHSRTWITLGWIQHARFMQLNGWRLHALVLERRRC